MAIRGGSVPVGDSKMEYAAFGHGPAVLAVLPGLSDGLATVRGKALLLAGPYRPFFDRFTVYMFSRRDGLAQGVSIRDMAADQAEALRSLGVEKACVLGVSQGGMIAQTLAADWPELVQRLVVAVSAPYANERVQACLRDWIGFAQAGDHYHLMVDTAEKSYSAARLKQMRPMYPLLGRFGKPKDGYRRFLANAGAILAFDGREALGRITCPTLVIGGEDDRIVGAEGSRELHAGIAGSLLHMYPGLGHAAYEEAPDFYERALGFLGEEDTQIR